MDIRTYYSPVQPAINTTKGEVRYREFLPAKELQPFIYCYWQLKSNKKLTEPFEYRVVADGCIDIFFEHDRPEEHFVMGYSEQYTQFALGNEFHYVGIRFLPSVFPQLFNVPAHMLSNRTERLDDVLPGTSSFITGRLSAAQKAGHIKAMLDRYFLGLFSDLDFKSDSRFCEAVHIILKKAGAIQVEKDLNTGISPRQLRRLFKFYIGSAPKGFSKVVRFQKVLSGIYFPVDAKQGTTLYDAGYYDQPHLIKEFKNFYGLTPGKVFG